MKKIVLTIAISLASLLFFQGCSDFLEIVPKNSVPPALAINNLNSARGAVLGAYDELQDPELAFDGWLSLNQMFTDEMIHTGTFPTRLEFGQLNVFPANITMANAFTDVYDVINVVNNIIEVLPTVEDPTLDDASKNALLAHSYAIRAFCYWYLTNNWGDVPLVTTPTREVDESLNVAASPKADVMALIKSDLDFADANIEAADPLGLGSSVISKSAVTAMLARWYLFNGDNANALASAEEIITGGVHSLDADYGNLFGPNPGSAEHIWYLNFNTQDANSNAFFYFPSAKGGRLSISPSAELLAAYDPADLRYAVSFDTATVPSEPHLIKYKDINGSDPIYFIRYAEILLIAAEAAGAEGDFTKATDYINEVRTRAGVADVTLDASNYIDLILQERLLEFAGEGPNRLWDLRRTNKAEEILAPFGYDPCDAVWPLPLRDLDRNPNLVQNNCCNC
jgi:hypothetical protein